MNVIYFDVDDTLYDRSDPFVRTYETFFGRKDPDFSMKAFRTCQRRSDEVFEDSQKGRITMEEMYIYRYQKGFADLGVSLSREDALRYQEIYLEKQGNLHYAPGIPAVLDFCKTAFDRIGVITNGPGPHQRRKLKSLGVDQLLDPALIFISGEFGEVKPYPEIFEAAQKAAGVPAENIIYVGDSYSVDVSGAAPLGWKTVWLNKKKESLPQGGFTPDYTIPDGKDLLACLKKHLNVI